MKHAITVLGLGLCACVAGAGDIDTMSRSVVFLRDTLPVLEQVNGVTLEAGWKVPGTNIFIVKTRTVTGTGLIVVSSNISYLVTAKHVATNMTPQCEVVMGGENKEPLRFRLSQITGQPGIRWFHHTNADVSLYPLPTMTIEGLKALERRAMPLAVLESGTNVPSRDIHLTALGFPLGLGAEGEFLPLCRESKVSGGFLNDGSSMFFLPQDPSVSGYSGGPVIEPGDPRIVGIQLVRGGTRCWGFVSGTFGDESGGKMCKVVPAFYAVGLVREAEATLKIVNFSPPPPEKK
jgi:hypothetical protein